MATVTITCPHCGLAKDVPNERIPAGSVRITCPQCRKSFVFESIQEIAIPSAPAAPPPPAASYPDSQPSLEKMAVNCHHCGLMKEVPLGAIPAGAKVTCPRCRNIFVFGETGEGPACSATPLTQQTPPPAGDKPPEMATSSTPVPPDPTRKLPRKRNLSKIGELFSNSWTVYKRRVWTLLALDLIVLIPILMLVGTIYLIRTMFPDLQASMPLLIGVSVAGLIAAFMASLWGQTSFIFAIADDTLTFREALDRGWHRIGSFIWLSLLMGFIVMGGFLLFLIPGIIFTVWFFFGQFALAGGDERGMNALLKSREYVKGHFFEVLLRLFVVWFIWAVIGAVPLIGPILAVAFVPFAMIFAFLVYQELREIKGDVSFPSSAGEKFKWIGAGLLGYVLLPIIMIAWLGTALFALFSGEKLFFRSIDNYSRKVMTAPPGKPPEMPLLLKMAQGQDVVPVSKTAAQYDALLASQKVDFEDGTKISVGPAAFLLDHFWDRDKAPSVWLKVRVVPLPNLDLGEKFTRVVIEHVRDRENRDIYDPANTFEDDFFQRLSLSRHEESSPYFEAIRDIHLLAGAKEKDLSVIEGTLFFKLPEEIKTVTLDPSMAGREIPIAGEKITLKEMAGGKVSLAFQGDFTRHIKTVGYDRNGKPLLALGSSSSTQGAVTTFSPEFNGEIRSVKVIVACGFVERKYPFRLEH